MCAPRFVPPPIKPPTRHRTWDKIRVRDPRDVGGPSFDRFQKHDSPVAVVVMLIISTVIVVAVVLGLR